MVYYVNFLPVHSITLKVKFILSFNGLEDLAKKHNTDIETLQHQLDKGMKVEMEHTKDKETAKKIAMDHLYEVPDYYDRLKKVE